MDAKDFKKIITTTGMHEAGENTLYTIKDNDMFFIFKSDVKDMYKSPVLKLIGIYNPKMNLLMNAKALVETYVKEYKAKIRGSKKAGTFDYEEEKSKIQPICNVLSGSSVKNIVSEAVNERVTAYISKTYDKTDTKHAHFDEDTQEHFERLKTMEDIERFVTTGPSPIPYKSSYLHYADVNYKGIEEFFEDQEAYINKIYDAYMKSNEEREHKYLVMAHMKDLAAAAMMEEKDHPAHLKRQINYTINKSFKEVTLELNSKDTEGKPITLSVPTDLLRRGSYVDGFNTWALDYGKRTQLKKLCPELEKVKYDDIKTIKHGNSVIFEDVFFTRP